MENCSSARVQERLKSMESRQSDPWDDSLVDMARKLMVENWKEILQMEIMSGKNDCKGRIIRDGGMAKWQTQIEGLGRGDRNLLVRKRSAVRCLQKVSHDVRHVVPIYRDIVTPLTLPYLTNDAEIRDFRRRLCASIIELKSTSDKCKSMI